MLRVIQAFASYEVGEAIADADAIDAALADNPTFVVRVADETPTDPAPKAPKASDPSA